MKETKYKAGDIVKDKANTNINIVILYPLRWKKRGYQRYKVSWYDHNQFNSGTAFEHELI